MKYSENGCRNQEWKQENGEWKHEWNEGHLLVVKIDTSFLIFSKSETGCFTIEFSKSESAWFTFTFSYS
jgi:hypothetical protein